MKQKCALLQVKADIRSVYYYSYYYSKNSPLIFPVYILEVRGLFFSAIYLPCKSTASLHILQLFRAKQNFIKKAENACIFKPVFEILFGGWL